MLDPTASIGMAMMSGDSEMELAAGAAYAAQSSAADGEVDTSASSMAFENEMMEGEEESSSNSGGSMPMPQIEQHRLEREYIWGPGDGIAGIDELFVMFDRDRAPWLVLQDASGDVAALCSTSQQNNAVIAQVAAQWTWDAYGNVFSADHIAPHPFMRVGHKGLFVERLDTGVADASVPGADYVETPRLVPFARLVYHNRNRSYSPEHGRFLQADPNASGMVVVDVLAFAGSRPVVGVTALELSGRLVDSPNLYSYLGATPWSRADPTGLFLDDIMGDGFGAAASATAQSALSMMTFGLGDFVRGVLGGMVAGYSDNLMADAEWAANWSAGDDFHSRGAADWIDMAALFGVAAELGIDKAYSTWDDYLDEDSGPPMAVISGSGMRAKSGLSPDRGPGPLHKFMRRASKRAGIPPLTFGQIDAVVKRMQREFPQGLPKMQHGTKVGSVGYGDTRNYWRLDPPHKPRDGAPASHSSGWHVNWSKKGIKQKSISL